MMETRVSEEPDYSATIPISRVICDFIIVLAMAIPLAIFHEFVKPYKRGFYCDDETIRYPYQDSTVPTPMLVVIGLSVPIFIIIAVEVYRALAWERKCQDQLKTYRLRRFNVHRMAVRLYCFLGYFLLGALFNQWIIDITKYTIGRQRPHFMEVCKPTVGYDSCLTPDKYITEFECQGTQQRLVKESMLSFYSGHSAFSFYAAWFTVLYLQARLFRPLVSRLFLPFIQFILLAGATYISLTRISDYKHHWSDVLVGAIMGTLIGNFVALFVAEVFKRREIPPCELEPSYGLIRAEKGESIPVQLVSQQQSFSVTGPHKIRIANEENDDSGNQRLGGSDTNGGGSRPGTAGSGPGKHRTAPDSYGQAAYSIPMTTMRKEF
ncbi:hypothetical protein WR25_19968 isoform C [Diploscapter pachys]|uniref:Phosphatidic acid phosphatase type 2/haloperoxidase domain-containing protein n=1 Tax=Diploscapter pachys TaxID=2018661 RepID=A0A2A2KV93_9BILA|nr:hypothetical protein WR25_19968 isoform C [Diploscapter pachys]